MRFTRPPHLFQALGPTDNYLCEWKANRQPGGDGWRATSPGIEALGSHAFGVRLIYGEYSIVACRHYCCSLQWQFAGRLLRQHTICGSNKKCNYCNKCISSHKTSRIANGERRAMDDGRLSKLSCQLMATPCKQFTCQLRFCKSTYVYINMDKSNFG